MVIPVQYTYKSKITVGAFEVISKHHECYFIVEKVNYIDLYPFIHLFIDLFNSHFMSAYNKLIRHSNLFQNLGAGGRQVSKAI